jgi:hypothetical protein
VRNILCPDPVEDQEEEALAAVAAEADLEEVTEVASEVAATEAATITIIITAPVFTDGVGAVPITAEADALEDFSEFSFSL